MELPDAGDVFIDRFELLDVLGRGGFACVFRAHDRHVGREVALKVLAPNDGEYSQISGARFVREARVLATLQHPASITLLDFGQSEDGLYWLASEFVRGEELGQALAKRGRFEPEVVVHLLRQVLGALSEAHGCSVIHRDIKPANLVVYEYDGDPWRVKLLDFGLAKPVNVDATRVTVEGNIIGTPRYMSPEQLLGLDLGPASDIYSLGLVVYEMLTGTPAIAGTTVKELAREQLKGAKIVLPVGVAPPALRAVVERMLARQSSERYESVAQIQRALSGVGAAERSSPVPVLPAPAPRRVEASSDSLPEREASPRSRSRALLLVIAGALLGAGAIAVLATMRAVPDDQPAPRPAPVVVKAPTAGPPRATPAPSVDAGEVAADVSAVDGCGKRVWDVGLQFFDSGPADVTRYVPDDYDPNHRYPLILVAHGEDENAYEFVKKSGLLDVAATHGVIVLAPQANARNGRPRRADRMEFFTGIVDFERRGLCIDPDRIFVVGQHHGAGDALILGCEPWVRAIAIHSHTRENLGDLHCGEGPPPPTLALWPMRSPQYPSREEDGADCSRAHVLPLRKLDEMMRKSWQCTAEPTRVWTEVDGRCAERGCKSPLWSCQLEGGIPWPRTTGRRAAGLSLGLANRFRGCDGPASTFPAAQTAWDFFASLESGP